MFGGFFRHLRQWSNLFDSLVFEDFRLSSGIVGGLRKSSEIIRICRKMAENLLIYIYTKQDNIGLFGAVFCVFFLEKIYCFKEFFTVSVKMPKNCFMLQNQNSEVFSVIEVPPFRPSLRDSLNNCQSSRGLTVCVLTKKKKKISSQQ